MATQMGEGSNALPDSEHNGKFIFVNVMVGSTALLEFSMRLIETFITLILL